MTLILCYIINYIPGLHMRASEDAEIVGMDEAECGEVRSVFLLLLDIVHGPLPPCGRADGQLGSAASSSASISLSSPSERLTDADGPRARLGGGCRRATAVEHPTMRVHGAQSLHERRVPEPHRRQASRTCVCEKAGLIYRPLEHDNPIRSSAGR